MSRYSKEKRNPSSRYSRVEEPWLDDDTQPKTDMVFRTVIPGRHPTVVRMVIMTAIRRMICTGTIRTGTIRTGTIRTGAAHTETAPTTIIPAVIRITVRRQMHTTAVAGQTRKIRAHTTAGTGPARKIRAHLTKGRKKKRTQAGSRRKDS